MFGPILPLFFLLAPGQEKPNSRRVSPFRRGKLKSSAASPRIFRNGTGWSRNPSSFAGAFTRPRKNSNPASGERNQWARLARRNKVGKCRAHPRDRLPVVLKLGLHIASARALRRSTTHG